MPQSTVNIICIVTVIYKFEIDLTKILKYRLILSLSSFTITLATYIIEAKACIKTQ